MTGNDTKRHNLIWRRLLTEILDQTQIMTDDVRSESHESASSFCNARFTSDGKRRPTIGMQRWRVHRSG
jgi:hypothetical protein